MKSHQATRACGGEPESGGPGAAEAGSGLVHIHALGADPAGGVLMLRDWSPGNALVTVDTHGAVGASANHHGGTWSAPGTPQARAAQGPRDGLAGQEPRGVSPAPT
ncbi:hypothetical protein [Streptomyces sp.]|uniref:hypothetical protein n=1 Tax=Streptomyces sp. TaxID=1931 RepID=UPI002F41148B